MGPGAGADLRVVKRKRVWLLTLERNGRLLLNLPLRAPNLHIVRASPREG
jgi:hypothetical protein